MRPLTWRRRSRGWYSAAPFSTAASRSSGWATASCSTSAIRAPACVPPSVPCSGAHPEGDGSDEKGEATVPRRCPQGAEHPQQLVATGGDVGDGEFGLERAVVGRGGTGDRRELRHEPRGGRVQRLHE